MPLFESRSGWEMDLTLDLTRFAGFGDLCNIMYLKCLFVVLNLHWREMQVSKII